MKAYVVSLVCSYAPCSKTFKRKPSQVAKGKSYCCRECKTLDGQITFECPTCKNTITIAKSLRPRGAKYCSKVCFDIAQTGEQVSLVCDCCKKSFTRKPSAVSGGEKTYCTDACQRKDMLGERHHRWKGGKSKTTEGYDIVLTKRENRVGDYTAAHRLVAEQCIGRELEKYEHVLHLDNDKTHNEKENLFICGSISESTRRIAGSLPWPTKSNLSTYEKQEPNICELP
jgi:hypothetical protein